VGSGESHACLCEEGRESGNTFFLRFIKTVRISFLGIKGRFPSRGVGEERPFRYMGWLVSGWMRLCSRSVFMGTGRSKSMAGRGGGLELKRDLGQLLLSWKRKRTEAGFLAFPGNGGGKAVFAWACGAVKSAKEEQLYRKSTVE